ncbi:hypothetical protein D1872_293190 [compost metagenome]
MGKLVGNGKISEITNNSVRVGNERIFARCVRLKMRAKKIESSLLLLFPITGEGFIKLRLVLRSSKLQMMKLQVILNVKLLALTTHRVKRLIT